MQKYLNQNIWIHNTSQHPIQLIFDNLAVFFSFLKNMDPDPHSEYRYGSNTDPVSKHWLPAAYLNRKGIL